MTTELYGDWICHECGTKYGTQRQEYSTWHNGFCDYCLENKSVTEIRDYGYPQLPIENIYDQIVSYNDYDPDDDCIGDICLQ